MLVARHLRKRYRQREVVKDFSLHLDAGEVVGLLGPNGAGKTTTVRMMTSILAPTAGWARVAGYDVTTQAEQVREHVGVLTEQHGLYERMKALEYLRFFGQVYHMDAGLTQSRALALMDRFGLSDALDKRLGEYSKGMKQKLALVRALLHNPPVLLLDEPTSAMDPLSAKQVRDAIIDLQRDQRTFLITTHNLTEAQTLADSIAFIRKGKLVANGTFDALRRQFVGEPRMELRIAGRFNGMVDAVRDIVTVRETGEDWIRYTTPIPERDNPNLIRALTGLGVDVVTLAPVTQTLEDVYLQVVKEDEGTATDGATAQ